MVRGASAVLRPRLASGEELKGGEKGSERGGGMTQILKRAMIGGRSQPYNNNNSNHDRGGTSTAGSAQSENQYRKDNQSEEAMQMASQALQRRRAKLAILLGQDIMYGALSKES